MRGVEQDSNPTPPDKTGSIRRKDEVCDERRREKPNAVRWAGASVSGAVLRLPVDLAPGTGVPYSSEAAMPIHSRVAIALCLFFLSGCSLYYRYPTTYGHHKALPERTAKVAVWGGHPGANGMATIWLQQRGLT